MIILGLVLIVVGIWLYMAGKDSKGSEVWKILSWFVILMGIVFLISPLTSTLDDSTKDNTTTNSVYSSTPQSGTTDLQERRQEWRERANEAYEENNYGFY